ncbi:MULTISPECIES: type II toxin-antitoxin system RelE/ParE family toxin [unclassified Methylobacterium]|uniref:type II toxin-antitoxin system RelE/ParE family toxin n=1 Tax=unclassified Methylobacterium TaxID=2615210 RepID=UPI0011C1F05C|nr:MULTISPECIES: type II toxin-antitoxin system RelE/ParE family toxin [unclassified Methylobacterium]QEE38066.1 type II toxin-antitoxin system RelE/ParE family toxin [Methylobacterium sp. WL1]RZK91165.1 MAG: type II toxin-antitoxin system RelE/ParE family toxin [Methylobacterium sp.]TXN59909.1 type II toxin-antitoxin system RelE/ParE family toxin [Methylobacterium sp. WL2]TXN76235.1 type II toxin-antitoxin system RelE/ParE family toxin [Methylobacterium sp. WL18]
MKRRSIIYAPAAGDDLDWIYDTIAQAGTPAIASGFEQSIRAFCEGLEYGAERGTLHSELRPGLRTIGFARRVTVAFTVEDRRVVILRIFYGGRDWEADFG